jgi:hypothetical protein
LNPKSQFPNPNQKMSSVSKLFIRIPLSMSEKYVSDAIDDMRLCKVRTVSIKKYTKYSTAIATIEYWYKFTEDIRNILNRGDCIYIPTHGNDLAAYKFLVFPEFTTERSKCRRIVPKTNPQKKEVDEFGRDMPRGKPSPSNKSSIDRDLENAKAASNFIAEYNASNTNNESDDDSLAKNAPENLWKISEMLERREIEERENYLYCLRSHCNDEEEYAYYEGTDLLSDVSDE